MNSNLHDKLKIDISESNLEVTNSIDAFNKNLDKMDKYLNSKNDSNTNPNINNSNSKIDTNIKINSELENINDSSSIIPLDNNIYNLKINNNISKNSLSAKKIADPSSDLLCQKLQQKIDTLNYDNFALSKKNKDLLSKNEELKLNLASINHAKETELQMINEELISTQNKLKLKEEDILSMKEKIKLYEKDINQLEKNKKNIFELRTENDKLKKNQKKLNETINKFEQNLDFYKNKYNEVSSSYEILKKEKENMNKDTFVHKEKNKELNIDNERLKDEINELKEEKNNLLKKISDYDINQKKKYNELIDRTKQKMEAKQKEEIERIQNDENNIMKIKIKSLEEQNEDLKIKIQELKNNQKQNNNDLGASRNLGMSSVAFSPSSVEWMLLLNLNWKSPMRLMVSNSAPLNRFLWKYESDGDTPRSPFEFVEPWRSTLKPCTFPACKVIIVWTLDESVSCCWMFTLLKRLRPANLEYVVSTRLSSYCCPGTIRLSLSSTFFLTRLPLLEKLMTLMFL